MSGKWTCLSLRIVPNETVFSKYPPAYFTVRMPGGVFEASDYEDFGEPRSISKIVYTPRNYDNYVKAGNLYELFYCDRTWKSAGIIEAESDFLTFKNVPSGTLYLLKNHSEGIQERVFSYKAGRQLWDLENEGWVH